MRPILLQGIIFGTIIFTLSGCIVAGRGSANEPVEPPPIIVHAEIPCMTSIGSYAMSWQKRCTKPLPDEDAVLNKESRYEKQAFTEIAARVCGSFTEWSEAHSAAASSYPVLYDCRTKKEEYTISLAGVPAAPEFDSDVQKKYAISWLNARMRVEHFQTSLNLCCEELKPSLASMLDKAETELKAVEEARDREHELTLAMAKQQDINLSKESDDSSEVHTSVKDVPPCPIVRKPQTLIPAVCPYDPAIPTGYSEELSTVNEHIAKAAAKKSKAVDMEVRQ